MSQLPFNLDILLHPGRVENERVEFKGTWDDNIKPAVTRTICAFANDLLNLNGGYIILGVDEDDQGRPMLPPRGLRGLNIDRIQREIRGQCARIDPVCTVACFSEIYHDRPILIIRVPAGDSRPYQAPRDLRGGERIPYVRSGPETEEARGEKRRQLIELTNRTPFDSRRNATAGIEEISPALVRRYLSGIRSDLARSSISDTDLFRTLDLLAKTNAHEVPKNIALLMFSEQPHRFFRGAFLEVAHFGDDAGGDVVEERSFKGPLPAQVREVLSYLDSMTGQVTRKQPNKAEALRFVAYPYEAMEEAIVNAVYHRSYQEEWPEPVKIYLYPNRMEITSYPGPVAGIRQEHVDGQTVPPPVPARNQRIGEFLKDLRLAERRNTGLAKIRRRMRENGSPEPAIDFAENYFRVTLPAHPGYTQLHAIREAAQFWAIGNRDSAIQRMEDAVRAFPSSGALTGQLIEYLGLSGNIHRAAHVFHAFRQQPTSEQTQIPFLRFAEALINAGRSEEAKEVLSAVPSPESDAVQIAILHKRASNYEEAHRVFEQARPFASHDPKFLQEFAQTKMHIARNVRRDRATNRRLLTEAEELLRRAIALSDQPARTAWCWFDLAGILTWLGHSAQDIERAYLNALAGLPAERRIQEAFDQWKQGSGASG